MSRQLAAILADQASATANVGARPAAAGDGVDITKWRSASFGPRMAIVEIEGDQLLTVSPLGGAAGVEIWALIRAKWKMIGWLNSKGNILVVDATHGYAEELADLAAATRLAIAGQTNIGTATYTFVPLETWGSP